MPDIVGANIRTRLIYSEAEAAEEEEWTRARTYVSQKRRKSERAASIDLDSRSKVENRETVAALLPPRTNFAEHRRPWYANDICGTVLSTKRVWQRRIDCPRIQTYAYTYLEGNLGWLAGWLCKQTGRQAG